ncbi:MAG: hypothetical protein HY332_05125 [Chloroflexi bacterium]|nr:hypothetical protein [Chloroflexota bacterium]
MPPSQFSFILRTQLMVTQDRFWETLLTRRPVRRPPAPTPELAPAPPQWVVDALKYQFGKSEEEIAAMTPDEAEQYVREQWDKPRDG